MKSVKSYISCIAENNLLKRNTTTMNSKKIWKKIGTIFMNQKDSKTSDSHRLLLDYYFRIKQI